MKVCCPACYSYSVERIKYSNINSDIPYQYRTSVDKGLCMDCGSLWFYHSISPHLAKKAKMPSYQ